MFMYCYFEVYVFLLLCVFCSVYCFIVLFCVFFVLMRTVLLPPGDNPIAVNKYNISYHTSLPCSQKPANFSYPDAKTIHSTSPIHFKIILLYTPRFCKWSLSSGLFTNFLYATLHFPVSATRPVHPILLKSHYQDNI